MSLCDNKLSFILAQTNAAQQAKRDSKDGVRIDFWIQLPFHEISYLL